MTRCRKRSEEENIVYYDSSGRIIKKNADVYYSVKDKPNKYLISCISLILLCIFLVFINSFMFSYIWVALIIISMVFIGLIIKKYLEEKL